MLAALRSDVADDLATSGSCELALEDRRELARQLALTRLRNVAAERVALGQAPIEPIEEQRLTQPYWMLCSVSGSFNRWWTTLRSRTSMSMDAIEYGRPTRTVRRFGSIQSPILMLS